MTNMSLLSADDVHYKTFTPTKFREGYDQDEVDEFLDQVVYTIQTLEERAGGAAAPVVEHTNAPRENAGSDDEEIEQLRAELAAAHERIGDLESERDTLAGQLDEARTRPAPSRQSGSGPDEASSMLAIAQRVHDEYVRDGEEEGNRIVAEARAQGEQIKREANDERTRILDKLESERTQLEQKVDDLKQFEREYRAQIRSHLETLINTVDSGTTR